MNREELKQHIRFLADRYNTKEFIKSDPIQFPHRYKEKRDIEVSAVITQWISYGNRKAIIEKGNCLDSLMSGTPYLYIANGEWQRYRSDGSSLYRFFKWSDFYDLCFRLNEAYRKYDCLEDAMLGSDDYSVAFYSLFAGVNGIPNPDGGSASKRIWMMLRWLVRTDGIVDLGIWRKLSAQKLLIPVDVHVLQEAQRLGITKGKSASRKVANEITEFMREIFPDDPCRGDFALFGIGVDSKEK